MPTAEDKQKVAIEVARRDIDDIKRLQEFEPFRRYFIRRLEERGSEVGRKFKESPPAEVDKEEREHLRKLLLEYESILGMMEKDMAMYTSTLPQTDQAFIPGTRGNG